MIERCSGFRVGDKFFATIEEAQRQKLEECIQAHNGKSETKWTVQPSQVANLILDNSAAIIDILTTGPKSRPKARKINRPKRPAAPKIVRHEAEQFPLPAV